MDQQRKHVERGALREVSLNEMHNRPNIHITSLKPEGDLERIGEHLHEGFDGEMISEELVEEGVNTHLSQGMHQHAQSCSLPSNAHNGIVNN